MDFYFIFLLFGKKFELNMDRKQTTKEMRYYMKILSVYKDHKIKGYVQFLNYYGNFTDFENVSLFGIEIHREIDNIMFKNCNDLVTASIQ